MNTFNGGRVEGDWNGMIDVDERYHDVQAAQGQLNRGKPLQPSAGRGRGNPPRAQAKRSTQQWRQEAPTVQQNPPMRQNIPQAYNRPRAETAPRDDPMFGQIQLGGVAMQANYCRNMDYGGFASLVEATYEGFRKVDAQVDRALPFPIFQHTCVSAINAKLISHAKVINQDNRFNADEDPAAYFEQTKLPAPISAYLGRISGTTTPGGENVRLNIPSVIVPQGPIANQAVQIGAGSFGAITPENHNKYEVAMAPIVSARLIQESAQRANNGQRNWAPLPDGAYPANGSATPNMLGYHELRDYNPDGRGRLQQVVNSFVTNNSTQGKILLNDECNRLVTTYLTRQDRIKSMFGIPLSAPMPSDLTFVETSVCPDNTWLSSSEPTIFSSNLFGSSQSAKERLFCMRRRRTGTARGLCYLVNNHSPGHWAPHINANFDMEGEFSATNGNGALIPELNIAKYSEAAHLGSRLPLLAQWIDRVQL